MNNYIIYLLINLFITISPNRIYNLNFSKYTNSNYLISNLIIKRNVIDVSKIKLTNAMSFCKKNQLDTTIAFFVDMSIHSGKKRFFIVDLQKEKIVLSSLCCHGFGKGSTENSPVYSNEIGSNCTSLGKYQTGVRAFSNWGINIHYKMKGLEKTNNNSNKRIIVLHSYDPISEEEIYPEHLPLGWSKGCPVISNKMMIQVDKLLKERKKSVLLWIYA